MKKTIISAIITLIVFIIAGSCSSCSTLFSQMRTDFRNDSIIFIYR